MVMKLAHEDPEMRRYYAKKSTAAVASLRASREAKELATIRRTERESALEGEREMQLKKMELEAAAPLQAEQVKYWQSRREGEKRQLEDALTRDALKEEKGIAGGGLGWEEEGGALPSRTARITGEEKTYEYPKEFSETSAKELLMPTKRKPRTVLPTDSTWKQAPARPTTSRAMWIPEYLKKKDKELGSYLFDPWISAGKGIYDWLSGSVARP